MDILFPGNESSASSGSEVLPQVYPALRYGVLGPRSCIPNTILVEGRKVFGFPQERCSTSARTLFGISKNGVRDQTRMVFAIGKIPQLIEDFDGDTYRAVYTVRFAEAVYVLHAFKKKSKRGVKTPKGDVKLIKSRLKDAGFDHAERFRQEEKP
jgi:phage-related protein